MGAFFDIILLVILLFFVLSGFRRGIVRSAIELAGFVAALVLSARFSGRIAEALLPVAGQWFPSAPQHGTAVRVLAAAAVFILCEIAAGWIASAADRVFRLPVLRQINALLGGAFGFFKGAAVLLLVCAVTRMLLPAFTAEKPAWKGIEQSHILQMTRQFNPVERLLREDKWNEVKWDENKWAGKQKL